METQTPVQVWLAEIQSAIRREKAFRTVGKRVVKLYEAGASSEASASQTPFNILYSNTDTLLPALYNAVPRPVVQRRYKDESPLGREAAKVGQRLLEFQLEASDPEYESFDDLMQLSVLQALVPGRGVVHFKYEAYFETKTPVDPADTIGHDAEEFDEIDCGNRHWQSVRPPPVRGCRWAATRWRGRSSFPLRACWPSTSCKPSAWCSPRWAPPARWADFREREERREIP